MGGKTLVYTGTVGTASIGWLDPVNDSGVIGVGIAVYNEAIDLVFDVAADDASKLYRVIGKFSNLTDITNAVGGGLKAFRFETGFGVGNDFVASSAEDGLSFGFLADNSGKLSIGQVSGWAVWWQQGRGFASLIIMAR